jgi:hypothetical protein
VEVMANDIGTCTSKYLYAIAVISVEGIFSADRE